MTKDEIFSSVCDVIRSALFTEDTLTRDTVAGDVDGWDSLAQPTILIMLERKFNIMIPEDEANAAENVGSLVDLVERKVSAK